MLVMSEGAGSGGVSERKERASVLEERALDFRRRFLV